jgi:DNA-binding IclR family transcriptional regulator
MARGTRADGQAKGIQSVEIGTRVLEAVAAHGGAISLSAIAAAVRMQPSHVYRYAVSLARGGLLTQTGTPGHYDLGPACARLGLEAMRRVDEVGIAIVYLEDLRARTRHSVLLAAWSAHGPTVIRWLDGAFPIPVRIRAGTTLPLIQSAVGQAFLAYIERDVTEPIVRGELESGVSHAASRAEVEEIIGRVRSVGASLTKSLFVQGTTALAAPVFNADGQPVLVMAVVGQSVDLRDSAVPEVQQELLAAARAASAELGYREDQAASRTE